MTKKGLLLFTALLSACSSPNKKPSSVMEDYELAQDFFNEKKNWGLNKIIGVNAYEAWKLSKGSKDLVVAVVDTGIRNHPDLKGSIFVNPKETGLVDSSFCKINGIEYKEKFKGSNFIDGKRTTPFCQDKSNEGNAYCLSGGIEKIPEDRMVVDPCNKAENFVDDDKNGYVDDVSGWDFSRKIADVTDNHGHGTHIAGIIAGKYNQDFQASGVAPNVKILPLKYYCDSNEVNKDVFLKEKKTKCDITKNLESSTEALKYAINQKVRIINYSGGGPEYSKEEFEVLKEAEKQGILVIAAAGNDRREIKEKDEVPANRKVNQAGKTLSWEELKEAKVKSEEYKYYPCSYKLKNVICVGASTQYRMLASFSNWGENFVDVFAPGEQIKSLGLYEDYAYMNGSSQATAFVSGVAALILSVKPELTPEEVRTIIVSTTQSNDSLKSLAKASGLVDAYRSVHFALKGVTPKDRDISNNKKVLQGPKIINPNKGSVRSFQQIQREKLLIIEELKSLKEE